MVRPFRCKSLVRSLALRGSGHARAEVAGWRDGRCRSSAASNTPVRAGLLRRGALSGLTINRHAESLSTGAVSSILDSLSKWVERTGGRNISRVTGGPVCSYLAGLRIDCTAHRHAAIPAPASPTWCDFRTMARHPSWHRRGRLPWAAIRPRVVVRNDGSIN